MNLVIIPARDEAPTVGTVVRAAMAAPVRCDVLVVDDGSRDSTAAEAREAGATVIETGASRGYGAALMRGFGWALANGYGAVVTMDADGQHDAARLEDLVDGLADADIVSGTRYHDSSPSPLGQPPPDRLRLNRVLTRRINEITGYALTDGFCGFKAYRTRSVATLALDEPGYGFPLQLWLLARRAGLRVVERPVERIYLPVRRVFGGGLDDVERRRDYYERVIERTLASAEGGERAALSRAADVRPRAGTSLVDKGHGFSYNGQALPVSEVARHSAPVVMNARAVQADSRKLP